MFPEAVLFCVDGSSASCSFVRWDCRGVSTRRLRLVSVLIADVADTADAADAAVVAAL